MIDVGVLNHLVVTGDAVVSFAEARAAMSPLEHHNFHGPAATGYRESPSKELEMTLAERITVDPAVMGGRPCVRGLRVSVGTVVGLVAAGRSNAEILALYPYLEPDDIRAALEYAAWRVDELERPFSSRTA